MRDEVFVEDDGDRTVSVYHYGADATSGHVISIMGWDYGEQTDVSLSPTEARRLRNYLTKLLRKCK